MADPRDRVELSVPESGDEAGGAHGDAGGDGANQSGRPWLALWFRCSGQYARAYRNAAGTAYTGRCPKCGKSVRFAVGPGGTNQRFFEVSC